MVKSPDAFRTISEVADWLGIQAHVLRFWESKFTQVKPIKRAGGRRYYRPADMLLLGGIKKLLHDDGLTIKGVQKILREEGMTHVSALSAPLDDMPESPADAPRQAAVAAPETGVVLKFGATASAPDDAAEDTRTATPDFERSAPAATGTATEPPLPEDAGKTAEPTPSAPQPMPSEAAAPAPYSPLPPADDHPKATPDPLAPSDAAAKDAPRLEPTASAPQPTAETPERNLPHEAPGVEEPVATSSLPGFLRRPLGAPDDAVRATAPTASPTTAPPAAPAPPEGPQASTAPDAAPSPQDDSAKPAIIDLPDFTPEADFPAQPGLLSRLSHVRRLPREVQPAVAGLLLELAELRMQMDAAPGRESNL